MRFVTTVICLLVLTGCLFASDKKARGQAAWAWATAKAVPAEPVQKTTNSALAECIDALQEVNDARKARGLPPFQPDAKLTEAALACAREMAARGIHGHLPESDFKHLSSTVSTNGVAAGCAALEPSWGWQSCCWDDVGPTHAGAAYVMGADGLRYNHIFVRTGPETFQQRPEQTATQPTQSVAGSCASGSCGTGRERRGLFRGR